MLGKLIPFLSSIALFSLIVIQPGTLKDSFDIQPSPTPTPNPIQEELIELNLEISELERRTFVLENWMDNTSSLLDVQERMFNSTVKQMEWMFGIFIALLTVSGLILAVLGVSLLNRAIEQAASKWFQENASNKIDETIQVALNRLEDRYDEQFADLYRRVENAFKINDQDG